MKTPVKILMGTIALGAVGALVAIKSGKTSIIAQGVPPCVQMTKYLCTPINFNPSKWSHDLNTCEKFINISKRPDSDDELRCVNSLKEFDREARTKGFADYNELVRKLVKKPKYLSALNDENAPPNSNNYVHPCDKLARLVCAHDLTKECGAYKKMFENVVAVRAQGLINEVESQTAKCEETLRFKDSLVFGGGPGAFEAWVRKQVKDKEVLKTLEDLD